MSGDWTPIYRDFMSQKSQTSYFSLRFRPADDDDDAMCAGALELTAPGGSGRHRSKQPQTKPPL